MCASKTTIFLATLLVIVACTAANPMQCFGCLELTAEQCASVQAIQNCTGQETHCYGAAGKFLNETGQVQYGIARGCINCTDNVQACRDIGTFLKATRNYTLQECEIECCTDNNCNNATTPTLPSGPAQCYSCLDADAATCQTNQVIENCRTNPMSLGITHCASAAGKFRTADGKVQTGIAKGCINCNTKQKACEDLSAYLNRTRDYDVQECEIECCTGEKCNTGAPTLPPGPTATSVPTTNTGNRQVYASEVAVVAAAFMGLYLGF